MIKDTNIQDRQFLNELIANVTEHHINTKFKYLLTNSNVTFKSFFDTNIPKFVTPNRYTTPFFSGHGPFAYYLHKININTHPCCQCGEEETSLHTIFCPLNTNITSKYFPHDTSTTKFTESKQKYKKFTRMCKELYFKQIMIHNTTYTHVNT